MIESLAHDPRLLGSGPLPRGARSRSRLRHAAHAVHAPRCV